MSCFQVAARTLIHLGSELITSDSIAIYELIKNAIDARAPSVNVFFNLVYDQNELNKIVEGWENNGNDENAQSRIEHDINHLDSFIIKSDLSENEKRQIDIAKKSNSFIDAAKLIQSLNFIEVTDLGYGMSSEDLDKIFFVLGTDSRLNKEVDGQPYLGNKGIGRISMMRLGRRSVVTSVKKGFTPYSVEFDWKLFDDPQKIISDIEFEVIEVNAEAFSRDSGTSIKIDWLKRHWSLNDVKELVVEKFLRRLRDPFSIDRNNFPIHVYYNGESDKYRVPIKPLDNKLWHLAQRNLVLDFDPNRKNIINLIIQNEKSVNSIEPYSTRVEYLAHMLNTDEDSINKIGKFVFKLKWFNRSELKTDMKNSGLSSDSRRLLEELNLWSGGIAIYRDGFRIGYSGSFEDKDFFKIDSGALRGKGFTLNRIQIIASLAISKDENKYLMDRSNREGLIENKQVELVSQIISELALVQLRETINSDKRNDMPIKIQEVISDDIGSAGEKLDAIRRNVTSIQHKLDEHDGVLLAKINEDLHSVSNHIKRFSRLASHLQEQREDIIELAGAGTMMHVIMHELARTTSQTRFLLAEMAKKSDENVSLLIKKLEKEIKTINVRIRQFDPFSTSGRHRSSKFDVVELITTIISGYSSKMERHGIDITFTIDGEKLVKTHNINHVDGFIAIALENLIANSMYWLSQHELFEKFGLNEGKRIEVDLDTEANVISVWDSGIGISPSDKDRIFIPGYTTKKSSRDGKGFGLFIAREVCQYNDGDLYLDSLADDDGRLRRFILELKKKES